MMFLTLNLVSMKITGTSYCANLYIKHTPRPIWYNLFTDDAMCPYVALRGMLRSLTLTDPWIRYTFSTRKTLDSNSPILS
jgi:hypothetical protein